MSTDREDPSGTVLLTKLHKLDVIRHNVDFRLGIISVQGVAFKLALLITLISDASRLIDAFARFSLRVQKPRGSTSFARIPVLDV